MCSQVIASKQLYEIFDSAFECWINKEFEDIESADLLSQESSILHVANAELWHLEDQVRLPDTPADVVAELKRRIDQSNQTRVDAANELDRLILELYSEQGTEGLIKESPLNTETPGQLADRLSILFLKRHYLMESESHHPEGTVTKITDHIKFLGAAYDRLIDGLSAGSLYFYPAANVKLYDNSKSDGNTL
jgi:hypothetical protein